MKSKFGMKPDLPPGPTIAGISPLILAPTKQSYLHFTSLVWYGCYECKWHFEYDWAPLRSGKIRAYIILCIKNPSIYPGLLPSETEIPNKCSETWTASFKIYTIFEFRSNVGFVGITTSCLHSALDLNTYLIFLWVMTPCNLVVITTASKEPATSIFRI
jgi:hypothetical protein